MKKGFIDPVSLITLGFLVVGLVVSTAIVKNPDISQDIRQWAYELEPEELRFIKKAQAPKQPAKTTESTPAQPSQPTPAQPAPITNHLETEELEFIQQHAVPAQPAQPTTTTDTQNTQIAPSITPPASLGGFRERCTPIRLDTAGTCPDGKTIKYVRQNADCSMDIDDCPDTSDCSGTCRWGYSSCTAGGWQTAAGSCPSGSICCGNVLANNCPFGLSYCEGSTTVAVCKSDKSGYDYTNCSRSAFCQEFGGRDSRCVTAPANEITRSDYDKCLDKGNTPSECSPVAQNIGKTITTPVGKTECDAAVDKPFCSNGNLKICSNSGTWGLQTCPNGCENNACKEAKKTFGENCSSGPECESGNCASSYSRPDDGSTVYLFQKKCVYSFAEQEAFVARKGERDAQTASAALTAAALPSLVNTAGSVWSTAGTTVTSSGLPGLLQTTANLPNAAFSYATAALATTPWLQTAASVTTLSALPMAIIICDKYGPNSPECQNLAAGVTAGYYSDVIGSEQALQASAQQVETVAQQGLNELSYAIERIPEKIVMAFEDLSEDFNNIQTELGIVTQRQTQYFKILESLNPDNPSDIALANALTEYYSNFDTLGGVPEQIPLGQEAIYLARKGLLEQITVYKGVQNFNADLGEVLPGGLTPITNSARQGRFYTPGVGSGESGWEQVFNHTLLGNPSESAYSSWTPRFQTAMKYAGSEGTVISTEISLNTPRVVDIAPLIDSIPTDPVLRQAWDTVFEDRVNLLVKNGLTRANARAEVLQQMTKNAQNIINRTNEILLQGTVSNFQIVHP